MIPNALKRAGALALGLLFAVALVETVPRALPGLMPKKVQAVQRIYNARNSWESMMRGDRDLGFALRPGLDLSFPSEGRSIDIRTKSLPVRGLEDVAERDIGTSPPYAGVAVGDSFTFCDDAPSESCWVRRLSDALGMSIATLGVNGYSNLAEARLLEKIASRMSPSLVLVGFFPNDFKDNLHFDNWTRSGTDDYWTWMRRKRRSDVSEALARNSILYRLFDAARRYGARDTFEYRQDGLDFVFRDDEWWRSVLDRPGQTPGFHLAEQAFDRMATAARKMNARLVVLLFPFKEQVYWSIARQYYRDVAHLEEIDMDAPFAAVQAALTKRGIDWCDLTPDLRAKAHQGPQLYLRVGAHWTDAGNAAAAESIAACLSRLGAVAPAGRASAAPASVPRS
jgi:SGNH hydrolase-like domain, acetyltransferase AlgX